MAKKKKKNTLKIRRKLKARGKCVELFANDVNKRKLCRTFFTTRKPCQKNTWCFENNGDD